MEIIKINIIQTSSAAGRIKSRKNNPLLILSVPAGHSGVIALYHFHSSNLSQMSLYRLKNRRIGNLKSLPQKKFFFIGQIRQFLCFPGCHGKRLLANHMLSCLQCLFCIFIMHLIDNSNINGVHILPFQKGSVIRIHSRYSKFFGQDTSLLQAFLPDTNRCRFDLRDFLYVLKHPPYNHPVSCNSNPHNLLPSAALIPLFSDFVTGCRFCIVPLYQIILNYSNSMKENFYAIVAFSAFSYYNKT